jgi:hypothetical protein
MHDAVNSLFSQWERDRANLSSFVRELFGEGSLSEPAKLVGKVAEKAAGESVAGALVGGVTTHSLLGAGAGCAVGLMFHAIRSYQNVRRKEKVAPGEGASLDLRRHIAQRGPHGGREARAVWSHSDPITTAAPKQHTKAIGTVREPEPSESTGNQNRNESERYESGCSVSGHRVPTRSLRGRASRQICVGREPTAERSVAYGTSHAAAASQDTCSLLPLLTLLLALFALGRLAALVSLRDRIPGRFRSPHLCRSGGAAHGDGRLRQPMGPATKRAGHSRRSVDRLSRARRLGAPTRTVAQGNRKAQVGRAT